MAQLTWPDFSRGDSFQSRKSLPCWLQSPSRVRGQVAPVGARWVLGGRGNAHENNFGI